MLVTSLRMSKGGSAVSKRSPAMRMNPARSWSAVSMAFLKLSIPNLLRPLSLHPPKWQSERCANFIKGKRRCWYFYR